MTRDVPVRVLFLFASFTSVGTPDWPVTAVPLHKETINTVVDGTGNACDMVETDA
jgi:hypothetical protein